MEVHVYTHRGDVCVRVNSLETSNICSPNEMSKYKGKTFFENLPPIFAIADAVREMKRQRHDTCIVISCVSGFTKTETHNNAFVIQRLFHFYKPNTRLQRRISRYIRFEKTMFTLLCLSAIMPRPSKVTIEDRINVIKEFMVHFVTNKLPAYTSPVWQEMSDKLQGRWTSHDVYTNVRENRSGILAKARNELGIEVLDEPDEPQSKQNESLSKVTTSEDEITTDSDDTTWNPDENRKGKKADVQKMETTRFALVLTEDEWNSIKPDGKVLYGKRDAQILKPRIWTNVISIAFWKQHKTNCAFVYKRANVRSDSDNSIYVIDIYGKCMSLKCGNTFRGHGEQHYDEKGLIIYVDTRDTRLETHEEVKRPLNGVRRERAAEEMIQEGCARWKRRQAHENMQNGDLEPAFLPNGDVMRQAKKEGIHAKLKVKQSDSQDLIRAVENISADPEYRDLIQAVGSLPFYVFYSTPAQLDAYKKYSRRSKKKTTIMVDATGSLVRKIVRPDNTKSGHIFLYSIVVNFEGTTQPVHHMLSEKHDTDFIEYWLRQWIRKGAPKPKVAVSDYSRALINGLCLAFNNRTIKSYLDICFAIIENSRGVIEPPITIILIDVAHLIHMVCRWNCFDKANQSCIKDFFIRCIALMVECRDLDNFGRVFTLTCAVGLQTHEDSKLALEIPLVDTAKDARHKLEGYIAIRRVEDKLTKHNPRDDVDYTSGPFENEATTEDTSKFDDDTKSRNRLVNWVAIHKETAKKIVQKGREPNAFYLPKFIEQLYELAKEFPLWTGVTMPIDSPHATSSYVESYFNDIKTRVFTTIKAPARVDIFIKELARNIMGETLLFVSKLKKSEMKLAEFEETAQRQITINQREKIQGEITQLEHNRVGICQDKLNPDEGRQEEHFSQRNVDKDPFGNTGTSLPVIDLLPTDLTFAENDSHFLGISLSPNTTVNDSDLKSTENWRGKAPSNRSVDDFSDIDLEVHENVYGNMSIEDINANISLDHSYSQVNNAQKPIDIDTPLETLPSSEADMNSNIQDKGDTNNIEFDTEHCDLGNVSLEAAPVEVSKEEEESEEVSSETNGNATIQLNKPQEAKTSKYFRCYPEIRQRNLQPTSLKKPHLLPNGNRCHRGIQIDKKTIFLRNTCPFDALVHILMTRAIDDLDYATFIEKSENRTLKFVSTFMENGLNRRILQERGNILQNFYEKKIALETTQRVLSYTIDTLDSIGSIVTHTMKSEPSVCRREVCTECSGHIYSEATLAPNHKTITRRGFGAMKAALGFKPVIYGLKCYRCPGKFTLISTPQYHLFLELDIRKHIKDSHSKEELLSKKGLECQLGELPWTIDLDVRIEGEKKSTVQYSLAGLVGFKGTHFTAYCRRYSGTWQVYDDLAENITWTTSTQKIEPHLAVYIRQVNADV